MGLAEMVTSRSVALEERALQVMPWGPWNSTGSMVGGVTVNPDNALQLLTVYGCVNLIADTIATLPRDVYRNGTNGTAEEVTNVPRWLDQPNPQTDIIDFLAQTLTSLLLDGNAYWAYGVDKNFLPTELHVLNPANVDVRGSDPNSPNPAAPTYWVNGVQFKGRLLHIKGITRPGALKGLSPVESARQSIGIGLAAQQFAASFYENGTILSGVIETPGAITTDQAREMKTNWSRDHAGPQNAHQPGVLTNGATWKQLSVTPEQAQFLESRQFQASEISAQLFLLDPSMLGISSAGSRGQNLTYANLEQRGIHLVQFTLMRWIIRLERAFTFLLPKPQYFKLNVDALQRADLKTRYEAYRIALGPNQPFLAVNEPRRLEDLPPETGFDKIETPAPPTPPPAPPADPVVQENHHHITVEAARNEIIVPQQPAPIVHVAAADPTPIQVTVEAAEHHIEVNPTPVQIHQGDTHVAAPEVVFNQPDINVNVAPPENHIDVHPTPIEVAAPEVHVAAPDVTVEAAQITVNQPEIRVEAPTVNVNPEIRVEQPDIYVDQPAITVESPTVHVRPPAIRIDAPNIVLPGQKKIRRTFERDDKDNIIAIVEEPIEDAPDGDADKGKAP